MKINNIKALRAYIAQNSFFSEVLINNVIRALGYSLPCSSSMFKELSSVLSDCAIHGASIGFNGFICRSETIKFFKENRRDIIHHMINTAADLGTDIISMVHDFCIFRNSSKPTPSEVGRALWDTRTIDPNLTTLYKVFAWYALEEVSQTWYRYLEENSGYKAELSA